MSYTPRHIKFLKTLEIEDWKVKVYLIDKDQNKLVDEAFYDRLQFQLPKWLSLENSFNAVHSNHAFLIVHGGSEGVFSIINWWVGKNMLNTHVFLSPYEDLDQFEMISGDGLHTCVWELEVINHERKSWLKHILMKEEDPDYSSYIMDTINAVL